MKIGICQYKMLLKNMGRIPKQRVKGFEMTTPEEQRDRGTGHIITVLPYEPCRNIFLCIYYMWQV